MEVQNGPITAQASVDRASIQEGETVHFTGVFDDPDTTAAHTIAWDFGDGSPGASTLEANHTYADSGSYTARLTITSSKGKSVTRTVAVTVTNAAPSVSIIADEFFEEGTAGSASASVSDAGVLDTFSYLWNMGDGSTYDTPEVSHAYASAGSYTITLTVTDKDGGVGTATQSVTVKHRAPDVNAGSDQSCINEGQTVRFAGTVNGETTFAGYTVHWDFGDGQTVSGTLSPTHVYRNQGDYEVRLTVTTSDGVSAADTLMVSVQNGKPAFGTVTTNSPILSNQALTLNAHFSDPGLEDELTLTVDWKDGSGVETFTYLPRTTRATLTHVYPASINGDLTLELSLSDPDGGTAVKTVPVSITGLPDIVVDADANRSPNEITADEGELIAFNGEFEDPGASPEHTITWDFGDGATASGTLTPTHSYADDGVYTVRLLVTGENANPGESTLTVTVMNVDPVLNNAAVSGPIQENEIVTLSGSAMDVGLQDTLSLLVDWGDGQSETLAVRSGRQFGADHRYLDNGNYPVSLTLTDDNGGSSVQILSAEVTNVAPTASIVLGGGFTAGIAGTATASVSDPGPLDTFTYHWDMGDGATYDTQEISHVYTVSGSYTITLTVTDKDGDVGITTQDVVVSSQPAAVEAGPEQTVMEGQETQFNGLFIPGEMLPPYTYHWDFGDGSSSSGSLDPRHTYADEGDYIVTLTVTDSAGSSLSDTLNIHAQNADPFISAVKTNTPIEPGQALALDVDFGDPGPEDALTLEVDWDDGQPPEVFQYPAGETQAHLTHTYPSSLVGERILHLKLSDADGGITTRTVTVEIRQTNDLLVTLTAAQQALAGTKLKLHLTVNNLGPSPASGVIVSLTPPAGSTLISGAHGCKKSGEEIRCPVGALPPGENKALEVTLKLPAGLEGTVHLTAAVAGDGIDPQRNNNQARASIQVVKEWIVLDEDFTGAPGLHWSSLTATTSPSGERFMGEFGNETVNLRLENLPDHRRVRLEFDLYLIRSWDGNQAGPGPDRWRLCFTGGLCLIDTTFSNWQTEGFRQAYPEAYPGGDFLSLTGAQSVNSLGYTYYGIAMDSTYHIVLTFDHADPDLLLSFSAFGLQPSEDESWGLDNVKISLLPPTGDRRILLPLVMR